MAIYSATPVCLWFMRRVYKQPSATSRLPTPPPTSYLPQPPSSTQYTSSQTHPPAMISPRSLLSTTLLLALTFTSAVTSNEVPTGSGRVIARKAATWNGAHTTDFGCLTSSGLITSLDSGACATFSWKLLPGPDFAPTVALVGSEGTCTLYGDSFKPEGGLFEGSSLLCYDKPDTVKDTPFYVCAPLPYVLA